jgi:hypothetical protein
MEAAAGRKVQIPQVVAGQVVVVAVLIYLPAIL